MTPVIPKFFLHGESIYDSIDLINKVVEGVFSRRIGEYICGSSFVRYYLLPFEFIFTFCTFVDYLHGVSAVYRDGFFFLYFVVMNHAFYTSFG